MKKVFFGIVVCVLMVLPVLVLGACGPKEAVTKKEDVTKEITVSSCADMTGVGASHHGPQMEGMKMYFRYVNEKLGGIDGVTVKFLMTDAASLDPGPYVESYKKARDVDGAITWACSLSSALTLLTPTAKEDRFPFGWFDGEGVPSFTEGTWYFAALPGAPFGAAGALNWWYENEWRPKQTRMPNLGIVYLETALGKETSRFVADFAERKGIPVVLNRATPLTVPDFTPYILDLKEAEADVVVLAQAGGIIPFLRGVQTLGLDAQMVDAWGMIQNPLVIAATGDAAIGCINAWSTLGWADVDVPGIKLIHDLHEEWVGPDATEERALWYFGWARAAVITEVIKQALKEVGYEGLTSDLAKGREILKEVAETKIKDFTAQGVMAPLTYAPDDHGAWGKIIIFRIDPALKAQKLSGWIDPPPLRPEQKTLEWWQE